MLKKISGTFAIVTAFLLLSSVLEAQDQSSSGTSSPYSRYGIGTLNGYSLGRSAAMGGIGIGTRYGFQINSGNPASYTAIDTMTFLMEFGVKSKHTIYEAGDKKNGSNDVNFNYLAFSFPLKKWWATAFGIIPLSDKGYNITAAADSTNGFSSTSIYGTGTLSKAFIGNAFKIGKNLSVGVNAWYLFGTLSDTYYLYFPYDAAAYDYLLEKKFTVHNFGVTAGMQYTWKTKNKNSWTLGAVFEPKQNMSSKYVILEERALFRNSTSVASIIDTISNIQSTNNGLRLPLSFGAGFSYSFKNKIIFGADVYHQKWSEASFLGGTQYLTNSTRYSSGLEITPDEFSIRNYWSRAQYRVGCFYDNSYLTINGEQIKGYGVTFGLGLPFSRALSSLNLSAELGRMGSTQNNLIRESYAKFTLHLLLHDRWFIKRKFD
ncbi:MAG: hypothetical protein NTY07_02545 [Bacteroidia bacterium]|nr:hypothetical protein [Bacteroidia bacterium]